MFSLPAMAWKATRVDELRPGHALRIGHAWFDHPFPANTFQLESLLQIGVLREIGIKRLFIDPEKSTPASMSPANEAMGLPLLPDTPPALREQIAAEARALTQAKAQHVEWVGRARTAASETAKLYQRSAREASLCLSMLNAGFPQAEQQADKLLEGLVMAVGQAESPLSLARGTPPVDAQQRHALQALDAVAIAAMMARRMTLSEEDTRALILATLLHGVGLLRLPANLRQESGLTRAAEVQAYRKYPATGAELVAACPGMPPAVSHLIANHRERLDASGFPSHKVGADVPVLARAVGLISEYVSITTRGTALIPTVALAQLYKQQRDAFGKDVIDAFVAALTVYPPGSFVALSDGSIGRVVRVSERERLRPWVMVYDPNLNPDEADIVDLSQVRSLSITSALDPRQQMTGLVEFLGGRTWPGLVLSVPPPLEVAGAGLVASGSNSISLDESAAA